MTNFRMKLRIAAIAATAFICCLSCVDVNNQIGGNLVPNYQAYNIFTAEAPIEDVSMRMADSLSGYSSKRITIGALRDSEYGLTTRSCAITMVPLFVDKLDFGKDPKFKRMIFQVAKDTTCVENPTQEAIFQNVNVYELARPIDNNKDSDCNSTIPHLGERITRGRPVYNGSDSLTFYFSEEFGKKFLELKNDDVKDIKTYFKKFPGIYIDMDTPRGEGGRINLFKLQIGYNSDNAYITGNYAVLNYEAEYKGVRKDTTMVFLLGAYDFNDVDSLFTKTTTYPQYCLNYTGHETRSRAGKAEETISIEGGGGLKPFIAAKDLKHLAEDMIAATGNDPSKAVINKATIVFPFEFPEDYKEVDSFWPDYLSPTSRIVTDTTTIFSSLSDSSSSDENQGDINRSLCHYAPDITYHMQQILNIKEDDPNARSTKQFNKGMYDVWFLIMSKEVTVQRQQTNSDLSEYYNYLAYQSYYGSMYGGYGGYGGYGNQYTNYYNYMMMAQYASANSSYESVSVELDKDRFYRASLNGPAGSGDVPTLKLVFSIPKE